MTDYPPLLKDLFNPAATRRAAEALHAAWAGFALEDFMQSVHGGAAFQNAEMKTRQRLIVGGLAAYLPAEVPHALGVLSAALPHTEGVYQGCYALWTERHAQDHPDAALAFLKQVGVVESSWAREDAQLALRPFIRADETRMLSLFATWARDANPYVRRLVAESLRPRGVWTAHLEAYKADPAPILPLLGMLKADPDLYVQKAVANNLNDISKDHPQRVLDLAHGWLAESDSPPTRWIVRRALRTLLKEGYPAAFAIFGFSMPPRVELLRFDLSAARVSIGGAVTLDLALQSTAETAQTLMIDYRVYYVKKSGATAPKLFRLRETTLQAGEVLRLRHKQAFAPLTTRVLYPGEHFFELVVNGVVLGERAALLLAEA